MTTAAASARPRISVVVLAYGEEPVLSECLAALLDGPASPATDVEVVLVDNGAAAVADVRPHPHLTLVRPPRNLGFSGGCEVGAAHAAGSVLVFLNSDAVPEPGAVGALAAAVDDPTVGLACGSVRLADRPDVINTVGNPVHFTGVVWVGGYGDPASAHAQRGDVASVTGAFMALRREVWDELGGFPTEYFAYHEDSELSLRAWQHGYRVVYEPGAVVRHHYVHDRSPLKHFLVQRNRLLTVLTVFPRPVLIAVLPAVVLYDAGQAVISARRGHLRGKLVVWASVAKRAGWITRRRAAIQSTNRMDPRAFADLLSVRMEPKMIERPPSARLLNRWFEAYWWLARRLVGVLSRAGR